VVNFLRNRLPRSSNFIGNDDGGLPGIFQELGDYLLIE
jgi:hypothetical protein